MNRVGPLWRGRRIETLAITLVSKMARFESADFSEMVGKTRDYHRAAGRVSQSRQCHY
jgi:hypothetical protein